MNNGTIITRIKDTLDEMLGKSYTYGSNVVKILRYKIDPARDRVYITADNNYEFDRTFDAIFEFLGMLHPVKNNEIAPPENGIIVRQVKDEDLVNLRDILMDNITKIKNDKSYIPQAEAIKGNVDSIINLAKTDIAYMAFFKNSKR